MEEIKAEDVYLGRTQDGARVWADVRLTLHDEQGHQTIEHHPIDEYWSFGASFIRAERHTQRAHAQSVGQLPLSERTIDDYKGGIGRPDLQRLYRWHARWHLNNMNAACIHMPSTAEIKALVDADPGVLIRWGSPDWQGWALKNVTCPQTGYQWGHAWLVKPIPKSVADEMRTFIERVR